VAEQDADALSPVALAYLRARNADPMCSFGDFAAVSHPVDVATALQLKSAVCDGIIAPSFEPAALEILRQKKKGGFLVLQGLELHAFSPPSVELREVYGVCFAQRRNDVLFAPATHLAAHRVVVAGGAHSSAGLSLEAQRDLTLASITVKYTQSNSVAYAVGGQVVGVGAGQQSRVDCVKLAARKVAVWFLRQHPKVLALPFKATVKKQDRINARVRYIEGDITAAERPGWEGLFEAPPAPLAEAEKSSFLSGLSGVALSSDAFFPFRCSLPLTPLHSLSSGLFIETPSTTLPEWACPSWRNPAAALRTRR
jgi:phosphoribosylaminoimidazolecarboxamide formyltransferase/IMP cyclohydrolase